MFTHLDMGSMVNLDTVMLIPGKLVIKGCDCITVLPRKKWLNFWFSVPSKYENSNIDQIKLKSSCSTLTPYNPLNIDAIIVLLYCISNLFNA